MANPPLHLVKHTDFIVNELSAGSIVADIWFSDSTTKLNVEASMPIHIRVEDVLYEGRLHDSPGTSSASRREVQQANLQASTLVVGVVCLVAVAVAFFLYQKLKDGKNSAAQVHPDLSSDPCEVDSDDDPVVDDARQPVLMSTARRGNNGRTKHRRRSSTTHSHSSLGDDAVTEVTTGGTLRRRHSASTEEAHGSIDFNRAMQSLTDYSLFGAGGNPEIAPSSQAPGGNEEGHGGIAPAAIAADDQGSQVPAPPLSNPNTEAADRCATKRTVLPLAMRAAAGGHDAAHHRTIISNVHPGRGLGLPHKYSNKPLIRLPNGGVPPALIDPFAEYGKQHQPQEAPCSSQTHRPPTGNGDREASEPLPLPRGIHPAVAAEERRRRLSSTSTGSADNRKPPGPRWPPLGPQEQNGLAPPSSHRPQNNYRRSSGGSFDYKGADNQGRASAAVSRAGTAPEGLVRPRHISIASVGSNEIYELELATSTTRPPTLPDAVNSTAPDNRANRIELQTPEGRLFEPPAPFSAVETLVVPPPANNSVVDGIDNVDGNESARGDRSDEQFSAAPRKRSTKIAPSNPNIPAPPASMPTVNSTSTSNTDSPKYPSLVPPATAGRAAVSSQFPIAQVLTLQEELALLETSIAETTMPKEAQTHTPLKKATHFSQSEDILPGDFDVPGLIPTCERRLSFEELRSEFGLGFTPPQSPRITDGIQPSFAAYGAEEKNVDFVAVPRPSKPMSSMFDMNPKTRIIENVSTNVPASTNAPAAPPPAPDQLPGFMKGLRSSPDLQLGERALGDTAPLSNPSHAILPQASPLQSAPTLPSSKSPSHQVARSSIVPAPTEPPALAPAHTHAHVRPTKPTKRPSSANLPSLRGMSELRPAPPGQTELPAMRGQPLMPDVIPLSQAKVPARWSTSAAAPKFSLEMQLQMLQQATIKPKKRPSNIATPRQMWGDTRNDCADEPAGPGGSRK
jgi:hypothetical protein